MDGGGAPGAAKRKREAVQDVSFGDADDGADGDPDALRAQKRQIMDVRCGIWSLAVPRPWGLQHRQQHSCCLRAEVAVGPPRLEDPTESATTPTSYTGHDGRSQLHAQPWRPPAAAA
jgi:hypothetical protein